MTRPTLADWGELRFLRWVRAFLPKNSKQIPISVGDDAAHLKLHGHDLIVTTDALIEGVHFKREWSPPRDLGIKSLACNLSDLAAMAARPVAAFLSLGVPPAATISDLKSFYSGLRSAGEKWRCPIAGGDLVRAPQWTINIMACGEPQIRNRVVRRSGARPGQLLYVTGQPGESGAGLEALRRGDRQPKLIARHNRPTPRLAEAHALAKAFKDLAMIDVSDGIANDAGHLSRESGVAIEIDPPSFPIQSAMNRYAKAIDLDPLEWALFGGEDYELLFTTAASIEKVQAAFARSGITTPVAAIGRVLKGRGVRILGVNGNPLHLPDQTFKHFQ